MFALETKLGEFVVLLALKRVGPEWGEQNSHAHALDLSLNFTWRNAISIGTVATFEL